VSTLLPPQPPENLPPRAVPGGRRRKTLILWILGGLLVLALLIGGATAPERTPLTAADVVDSIPATTLMEFCDAYFTLGDYDRAFVAFKRGYTQTDPPPEAIFDEALSRC
jgi:hypothetical protein